MINAYEILGVRFDATDEEIKTAFRKKAMEDCGLDGNRKVGNGEYYLEILLQAREILLNKEKRKQLDEYLGQGQKNLIGIHGWEENGISTEVKMSYLNGKTLQEKIKYLETVLNRDDPQEERSKNTQMAMPNRNADLESSDSEPSFSLEHLYGLLFSDNTFAFYYEEKEEKEEEKINLVHFLTKQKLPLLNPNFNKEDFIWEYKLIFRTKYCQLAHAFPAYSIIPISMIEDKRISLSQLINFQTRIQLFLIKNPELVESLYKEELVKLQQTILKEQKQKGYVETGVLCKTEEITTSLISELFEKYHKLKPNPMSFYKGTYHLQDIHIVLGRAKSINFALEECESLSRRWINGRWSNPTSIATLEDAFTGQKFWRQKFYAREDNWEQKTFPWQEGQVFYNNNGQYTALPLYKLIPPTQFLYSDFDPKVNGLVSGEELKNLYHITSNYLKERPELIENLFENALVKKMVK